MEWYNTEKEIVRIVGEITDSINQQVEHRGSNAAEKITKSVQDVLYGQRSGKKYKVPGTDGQLYTASAPGEAPANRTSAAGLRGSFKSHTYSDMQNGGLAVHSISESELKVGGHNLGELLDKGTKKNKSDPRVKIKNRLYKGGSIKGEVRMKKSGKVAKAKNVRKMSKIHILPRPFMKRAREKAMPEVLEIFSKPYV